MASSVYFVLCVCTFLQCSETLIERNVFHGGYQFVLSYSDEQNLTATYETEFMSLFDLGQGRRNRLKQITAC